MVIEYLDNEARSAKKAEEVLTRACDKLNNINACYNLAVLYRLGDIDFPPDPAKQQTYQAKTAELSKTQNIDLKERLKNKGIGTW